MFGFLDARAVYKAAQSFKAADARQSGQLRLMTPRTEEDQIKDFVEALKKLDTAIRRHKTTNQQLKDFNDQGTWDSFWGGLSGQSDKDLAKLVAALGESLETTQTVVQILTQLHTVNNNVLRGFNAALVAEIKNLQADASTLEGNQNGALTVLYEFKTQIDELLDLAAGYERCSLEVDRLSSAQEAHEEQVFGAHIRYENSLAAQEDNLAQLRRELKSYDESRKKSSEQMGTALKRLASFTKSVGENIASVEAKMETLTARQTRYDERISYLEQKTSGEPSWSRKLGKHVFSIVAILLATAALASNVFR